MHSSLFWVSTSLTLLLLAPLGGAGQAPEQPKHPHHHLHHALWELRDARKELNETRHDFGGHKEQALRDTRLAIHQIKLCLKHHKKA